MYAIRSYYDIVGPKFEQLLGQFDLAAAWGHFGFIDDVNDLGDVGRRLFAFGPITGVPLAIQRGKG